ncbi:MAG: hypothetical protein LBJ73_03180 [Rickettsiales bacterium]|jgi:hypothetical protein|nr:hypothetical protein [Rickettsiales bacterium]
MKKSTIVLALLVCAFVFQGAFDAAAYMDNNGRYEYTDTYCNISVDDYEVGIFTIEEIDKSGSPWYQTVGNYYDGYKHNDVDSYTCAVPDVLREYYLQGVCASVSSTYTTISTDDNIGRVNRNNTLANNENHCYCRLRKKDGNVGLARWVFSGSFTPASDCARNCARDCAVSAYDTSPYYYSDSAFRDALLAAFGS